MLINTFVHLSAQPAELDGETRAGEPALQQYASNRLQQPRETIKNTYYPSILSRVLENLTVP